MSSRRGRFRRQLRWLRLRRYPILSLDEYVKCRRTAELPPPRAIVLTFDDGYADNAELGSPLLQAADASAAVFVVSNTIGKTNGCESGDTAEHRRLLTSAQLRDLPGRRHCDRRAHALASESDRARPGRGPTRDRRLPRRTRGRAGCAGSPFRLSVREDIRGGPAARPRRRIRQRLRHPAGPERGCRVPLDDVRRVEVDGRWSLLAFALSVWTGYPPRLGRSR